jgi:hypothetical protein
VIRGGQRGRETQRGRFQKAARDGCGIAPIERTPRFSATAYTIRLATAGDDAQLRRIAAIDSQRPLAIGPVLLAELDGTPAAALSLADGRVIANPFVPTGQLRAHLRLRAAANGAHRREPTVAKRIRAALSRAASSRPVVARA